MSDPHVAHGSPHLASGVTAVIVGVMVLAMALVGLDPVKELST